MNRRALAWSLGAHFFLMAIGASGVARADSICRQRAADEAGYADAIAGRDGKPAREWGRNCTGYSPSSYQKDYDSGFLRGQRELCSEDLARTRGREDGQAFASTRKYNAQVFWPCPEGDAYDRVYRKAFAEKACRAEVAESLGAIAGKDLAEGRPGLIELMEHCGSKHNGELETAFLKAYATRASGVCDAAVLEGIGRSDAQSGKDLATELARVARCPEALRPAAATAYRKGFVSGQDATQRSKEAENERMRLEYDRMRAEAERPRSGRSFGMSFPTLLRVGRMKLRATCEVYDGVRRRALVHVTNTGTESVNFVGPWELELRNASGTFVGTERVYRSLVIGRRDKIAFEVQISGFKGRETERCTARYKPN